MLIDESTKELFKELITEELYSYTFEEKEVEEELPFKILSILKIDVENNFTEYVIKKEYSSWYGWQEKRKYLINDVIYNLKDNCLTPSPIKELTKPCLLPS